MRTALALQVARASDTLHVMLPEPAYPIWRFYVLAGLTLAMIVLLLFVSVQLVRVLRQIKGDLSVARPTAEANAALAADNSRLRGQLKDTLAFVADFSNRFGISVTEDIRRVREASAPVATPADPPAAT